MPKLHYRKGRFILEDIVSPEKLKQLRSNAYWRMLDDSSFETDNLGAAAHFRKFADDKVTLIFKRRFQEHYEVKTGLPLGLDPHQRVGVEWILSRKRSYLAHAPGAGKTAQAIFAACLAPGNGQTLFIVPPSLTLNWVREIEKFTQWLERPNYLPSIAVVPKSDRQSDMAWKADFIVCPDSMLTKDWVYWKIQARQWKLIAVDEASRFKESTAMRSLAFYGGSNGETSWPGFFKNARHVVLLDGSPMPNRPMELWAPTFALHPEAIDCLDQNDFGYRYCGARPNERGVWEFLYSSNEDELKEKLQKDFMHVVTEAELSHPERRRSMVVMSKDVRTPEQRTWERRNVDRLFVPPGDFGWAIDESASQGDLARHRRDLGLRKVNWVAAYVHERLEEKNESVLLFAWHRQVISELEERLNKWNPGVILGGVDSRYREDVFSEFQSGKRRLLIMNIAAGGRGHNLQRADRAVFAEFSWTDETNRQCEKRGSRRGSEKEFLRCDYIVCPNSLDERVLTSLFTKERRVRKVIG